MTREPPAEDETARILAAADGDPDARAWLVERWTPAIYRFLVRMVGDEADAADLSQEVMIRILRSLDRYDPARSFSAWAFGIARNAAIDEHRRRKHRRSEAFTEVADTVTTSPLGEATRREAADQLHRALAELPEMYREILVLYHFEHLKYTEIAEALGIPLGTVMNRIFRARARLRDLYVRDGLVDGPLDGEEAR